jgi:hypothetical protein
MAAPNQNPGDNPARPTRGTESTDDLGNIFSRIEGDLSVWEARLALDSSLQTNQNALHHLMAVASAVNLSVGDLLPSAPSAPPSATPIGGSLASSLPRPTVPATGSTPPAAGSPEAPDTSDGGLGLRLEGISATLHRLVALVASRIGATGYSIGVSVPAGISITVEFSLPTAGASPSG